FLAHLAGDGGGTRVEELCHVRALRPLEGALGYAPPEPRREARARTGVAGRAVRMHTEEDRVAVAVVPDLLDGERVPRRLALVPQLAAAAAPEPRLAGLARPPERLFVHPREHQHAPVPGVLHDRRLQVRIGHPSSSSSLFSSGSRSGRSWTIEAISAASAPAAKASPRCLAHPAPPEAITGTDTASAVAAVSTRS